MGLFDDINANSKCPYCGELGWTEIQTKDLGVHMYCYTALPKGWFTSKFERKFRLKMHVYPATPYDKQHNVWKNQAEKIEAMAKVPKEFSKLKFINVTCDCHSQKCQARANKRDIKQQGVTSGFGMIYHGKIKISKGFLIGDVYDLKKRRT